MDAMMNTIIATCPTCGHKLKPPTIVISGKLQKVVKRTTIGNTPISYQENGKRKRLHIRPIPLLIVRES